MDGLGHTKKIVFIDDETYEADLLKFSFEKLNLKYHIIYFSRSEDAYRFLETTRDSIFMVMSDVEMPGTTGLDLKKRIDRNRLLIRKSIPFIFYSSAVKQEEVDEAYELNIQGYFQKPMTIDEMTDLIAVIVKYWEHCFHPSKA